MTPARAAGFLLLALLGAAWWAELVAPSGLAPVLALAVLAASLAVAVALTRPLRPGLRRATRGLAALGVLVATLLLAGAPADLVVDPRRWSVLLDGVGQGLEALPGTSTPYQGDGTWARTVVLAAGGVLLAGLAVAAVRLPRDAPLARRALATTPGLLLAGVPAFLISREDPVILGVLLFAAVAAALWLETARAGARTTLGLVTGAALLGAALTPAIDGRRAWLDYEAIARSLSPRAVPRFAWDHAYGPLRWPRTGAEVLRVRMTRPVYLKAENLDAFDGRRWRAEAVVVGRRGEAELPEPRPRRWEQTLRVTVRRLVSLPLVGAGTIVDRRAAPLAVPTGSPGTYAAVRPLRPGDAYRLRVYAPAPAPGTLARTAGAGYPAFTASYRELTLPAPGGRIDVAFPAWEDPSLPLVTTEEGRVRPSAPALAASPYARAYRLARRLREGSASPYDFARRVRRWLLASHAYSEDPPAADDPLLSFLFDVRRGYCQHFSGAMALLLRMGGVPARVATGFTPGVLDPARGEHVVHDEDAHSWVESWFPGHGWVTLDPTPSVAPALLELGAGAAAPATTLRAPSLQAGERPVRVGGARAGADDGGPGPVLPAVVALAVLAATGLLVRRRQHGAPPPPGTVEELERALVRCGRPEPGALTLDVLERRLRAAPDAAAYVRLLREGRYGWSDTTPTPAHRRALRAELARGLGARGSVRALWALPPRPYPGRAWRTSTTSTSAASSSSRPATTTRR
jgi:protein-glutamine gamma-glutamyltransferase